MKHQKNSTRQVPSTIHSKSKTPLRKILSLNSRNLVASICIMLMMALLSSTHVYALNFPAAGWHRGDVSVAQENSAKAILAALQSKSPNIEVDVLDFIDENGNRVGLLAHDYKMDRISGIKGKFIDNNSITSLSNNTANPDLSPESFITVIDLFELINQAKSNGVTPHVSLDMKEEGKSGHAFGKWIGDLIREYGFQDHVFASSFHKSNIVGVDESCPECYTGGLIFNDHYALKHLDYKHSSLDLTTFSKLTYFLGFLGKKQYQHDFILIQDDILIDNPNLVDYWKKVRGVKFVGVFVYEKERPYSEQEWKVLKTADWLELDPPQMQQLINREIQL